MSWWSVSGAMAAIALAVAAGSAEAQISTTAWYSAVNKSSNKCIDAAGAGTANGTAVQQWTCNGTNAQNWQFQTTDSGYYKIVTRGNAAQAIDVQNVSTADGAKLQLWAYGGGTN